MRKNTVTLLVWMKREKKEYGQWNRQEEVT